MSKSRSALGSNPLSAADAFLDDLTPHAPRSRKSTPQRTGSTRRTTPARSNGDTPPKVERPKTVRGTFQMREDLLQSARNAVVALSGPPHRMTLAALVEGALAKEIERLQKKFNDGTPFPEATAPLRQGRPIGS